MYKKAAPHSIEYFGSDRNHLWNVDYVGLLASRLGLRRCKWVLDVGCGQGHWTRTLLPWLAHCPRLVGVDLERDHLAEYERVVNLERGVAGAKGIQASADQIPMDANKFDLVTCQTLLMHVPSPEEAVQEMVRVTKPGGLVVCVEPNNTVARMPLLELSRGLGPDDVLLLSELGLRISIGLQRRGKSEEFVGERLPALLQDAGLEDIQVWLSDKAFHDLPPYDSDAQKARQLAVEGHWRNGTGAFDEEDAKASFLAADGNQTQFDRCWQAFQAAWRDAKALRDRGRWRAAGGGLLYIAAGRKPLDLH